MMKCLAPTRRTGQSAWCTPVAQSVRDRVEQRLDRVEAMRISATLCCTSGW